MELSPFVIRLAVLAMPGILASSLYRTLRGVPDKRNWEVATRIFLFSFVSYVLYAMIAPMVTMVTRMVTGSAGSEGASANDAILQALYDHSMPLEWSQIFWASMIAVVLAFVACGVKHYGLPNRLGVLLRVTRAIGDEDIWEYFHRRSDVDWVFVRDHKLGLVYYGSVRAYSDSGRDRELVLTDVDVSSNDDGTYLYSASVIYVSRRSHELTLEVPPNDEDEDDKIENERKTAKETNNASEPRQEHQVPTE